MSSLTVRCIAHAVLCVTPWTPAGLTELTKQSSARATAGVIGVLVEPRGGLRIAGPSQHIRWRAFSLCWQPNPQAAATELPHALPTDRFVVPITIPRDAAYTDSCNQPKGPAAADFATAANIEQALHAKSCTGTAAIGEDAPVYNTSGPTGLKPPQRE